MSSTFQVDGVTYDRDILGPAGQDILDRLAFVQARLLELHNQQALLTRAKNAYITDLKAEIVRNKSGVDLSTLFDAE